MNNNEQLLSCRIGIILADQGYLLELVSLSIMKNPYNALGANYGVIIFKVWVDILGGRNSFKESINYYKKLISLKQVDRFQSFNDKSYLGK